MRKLFSFHDPGYFIYVLFYLPLNITLTSLEEKKARASRRAKTFEIRPEAQSVLDPMLLSWSIRKELTVSRSVGETTSLISHLTNIFSLKSLDCNYSFFPPTQTPYSASSPNSTLHSAVKKYQGRDVNLP